MSAQNPSRFRKIKLAAVQAEPVFQDLEATTAKTVALITEAGAAGADLIGFPETWLPGFPNWYEELGECPRGRALDRALFLNSVEVEGPQMRAVADACARAGINAVIGINERLPLTTGTMFNTQVHIDRSGKILGKHQKYVPTSGERMVHCPGRTGLYNAFQTDFGAVSGLICGENSNPLAQYAAALSYPVVHVASWPAYFHPYFPMRHAIISASAGLAYSLKCFVVNSVSRISQAYIEAVADTAEQRSFLEAEREKRGGATILDCIGRVIADGAGQEAELLFAEINTEDVIIPKMVADTAGHYNRPELFAPLFAEYLSQPRSGAVPGGAF